MSDDAADDPAPPPRFPTSLEYAVGLTWRVLLLAVGIVALAYVFLALRLVTVPAVVALLLATLLEPPARRLRAHGWHPLLATWTVMLAALGTLVAIGVFVVPRVVDQFGEVGDNVQRAVDDIETWLVEGPIGLSQEDLETYVDAAVERVRGSASEIGSQVVSGAYLAVEIVAGLFLALVLTFFFVKDGDRLTRAVVDLLPDRREALARRLGRRIWSTLTAYVRGTAVVATVDAVVIAIGLVLIGVPLVLPLAVLTFIGGFFPLVGAVMAGLVAVLVALVSGGLTDALLAAGVVIVVQQVEGDVLQPVVMGRALQLHPVTILVALTAGAVLAGVLGAFLAVPITAVVAAAVSELRDGEGPSGATADG